MIVIVATLVVKGSAPEVIGVYSNAHRADCAIGLHAKGEGWDLTPDRNHYYINGADDEYYFISECKLNG